MRNIVDELKLAINRGLLHIFGAQAINRIVRFVASIIVVRLLSKDAFGSFSYAQNILQFFLLFNGMGVVSAILQFCSEKQEIQKKLPYLKYGLKIGLLFNISIMILILFYANFFQIPIQGSGKLLQLLCFMPIVILFFEIISIYLRTDLKNKEFSYLNIFSTLLYFLGTLIGGLLLSVQGIIFGRYVAFIIAGYIGFNILKKEFKLLKKIRFPKKSERKEFLKYSIFVTLTNSLSQILYLLDILLVGMIIRKESVVASYKVATMIPFALAFIPLSIMTFVYPYFARNSKDKSKLKAYFYKLQKYLIFLNLVISLFLIIFAPLIIKTLFGPEYSDSILPFRILSLGYFFSGSFRIPTGNVLASIRKVKINLYNAVLCGILNIILDIILIRHFGSVGAAVATTIIFVISSIVSNVYIYYYFRK